jgi:acetyl-CoA carboxylase biotin carboxyl carrier protein
MAQAGSGSDCGATPSPERLAELVQSLASVMCKSAVSELDLNYGSVTIRLRRPIPLEVSVTADAAPSASQTVAESAVDHVIAAPMIGTFYVAPSPGAPPFVSEGDTIYVGQTIGVIEAMKIMNEIAADRSGVVAAILVANGQPVEYGSPLLRLRAIPDAGS